MDKTRQPGVGRAPTTRMPSAAVRAAVLFALAWVGYRTFNRKRGLQPPTENDGPGSGAAAGPQIPPEWQLDIHRRTLDSLPATDSPAVQNFKQGRRLILACDGGGILGIITLQCLKRLEQYVGAPVIEIFDMFAGTSTGAIIAGALAAGVSVDDLIALYRDRRAAIFTPQPLHSGVFRMLGRYNLAIPKYGKESIRAMLRGALGDMTLAMLPRDVFITAKDTVRGETTFFTAFHNPADRTDLQAWEKNAYGTYKDIPVRAVIEASMSAPTYFKPLGRFVDGGVGAYNNTCYAAAVEAIRYSNNLYTSRQVGVYSFGTGSSLSSVQAGAAGKMSLLDWAQYVIGVGMSDANKQQVYVANNELCGAEQAIDFRRYQFFFTDEGLNAIGMTKPPKLASLADLSLDSIGFFDFLNDVGVGFGKYLADHDLFQPSASATVEELGRPSGKLADSYIQEIQTELRRAVA